MIRLITYNIHFGKRLKKILAWLATQKNTDIFCFQEFPQQQIADCMKTLKDKPCGYSFAPSIRRGKKIFGQLTVFRTDRMRLISSSVLVLKTNRLDRLSLGRTTGRSCLLNVFAIRRKKFAVANAHLSWLAVNRGRYRQIEHIVEHLDSYRFPNLFVGDFNITSLLGRENLFAFMKKYFYQTSEKRVATHRIALIKHQVDYVFGKKCEVVNLEAVRIRFSDHYPVIANVRLSH